MGKDWDRAVPSIDIWRECFRVLKSGAFAFVMCIPRQDCLAKMICNLSEAGFDTNFTSLYHCFASGFPKAQNIGKAVDKRPLNMSEFARLIKNRRIELKLSTIDVAESGHFYGDVNHGGSVSNWEAGLNVPTLDEYNKLIEILKFKDKPKIKRVYREITGKDKTRSNHDNIPFVNRGEFDRKDKPATPQAKALDGSYGGFQPKPAVEVILVAMKPLETKTFVDQALKNRKGITWLDNGRIPYISSDDKDDAKVHGYPGHGVFGIGGKGQYAGSLEANTETTYDDMTTHQGRFPANLLVSDDVLNDGRGHKSSGIYEQGGNVEWYGGKSQFKHTAFNDLGSFSRYFDLDKWWLERIKQLPDSVQKTFPFLIVPKASKSEKNRGLGIITPQQTNDGRNKLPDNAFQRGKTYRHNPHPTVKPLKLMSYLITLGSRQGDVVVDPFMGTGTTGVACEILGRKFIGIDLKEHWCEMAKLRADKRQAEMELKV